MDKHVYSKQLNIYQEYYYFKNQIRSFPFEKQEGTTLDMKKGGKTGNHIQTHCSTKKT